MKRIKSFLMAIILLFTCAVFVACKQGDSSSKNNVSVTLNLQIADIVVGGRLTLKATAENASEDAVWSSSDEQIATVSDGIVYGLSAGTSIITVKVNGAQATCTVNVVDSETGNTMQPIPVLHFELSAERIWVGYSFAPTALLKVGGTQVETEIAFSSSNTAVAKIENGEIVGVSVGETVITASCTYKGNLYQKTIVLTVVAEG